MNYKLTSRGTRLSQPGAFSTPAVNSKPAAKRQPAAKTVFRGP